MASPEELAESWRRIAEHPGYRGHIACQALNLNLTGVFAPNLAELLALLDNAAIDPMLAMELVQNAYRPDVREQFQAVTTQRLHNYVAATMTLVEHTRRLMRNRVDHVANEFSRRKRSVLEHGEISFIQDLRNFMLHQELPVLGHSMKISNVNTPNESMESEVELSVPLFLWGTGGQQRRKPFWRRKAKLSPSAQWCETTAAWYSSSTLGCMTRWLSRTNPPWLTQTSW